MSERFYEPGDTLWFCGRGFESRAIGLWTTSIGQKWRGELISHVGIIAEAYGRRIVHFESTTLNSSPCLIQGRQVDGVQVNDPWERIADYDGRVYLGRLRTKLTDEQSKRLTSWLAEQVGAPYDLESALLAGTTLLKRLYRPDALTLFCDELVSFALMEIGTIGCDAFNPSAVTPAWLARWLVRNEIIQPIRRLK